MFRKKALRAAGMLSRLRATTTITKGAGLLLRSLSTETTPRKSTSRYIKKFGNVKNPGHDVVVRHYSSNALKIQGQTSPHESQHGSPSKLPSNPFDFVMTGLSLVGMFAILKWFYMNYFQPERKEIIIFSGIDDEEEIAAVLKAIHYYEPTAQPIVVKNNLSALTQEIYDVVQQNKKKHYKTKLQLIVLSDKSDEDTFLVNGSLRKHCDLAVKKEAKTSLILYKFMKENVSGDDGTEALKMLHSLEYAELLVSEKTDRKLQELHRISYSSLIKQVSMALGDSELEILPLMPHTEIDPRHLALHTANCRAKTTCYTLGHQAGFTTDILRYPQRLDINKNKDTLSVLEKIWLNFVIEIETPSAQGDDGPVVYKFQPHLALISHGNDKSLAYETETIVLRKNLAFQIGEPLTEQQRDSLRGSVLTAAIAYDGLIRDAGSILAIKRELLGQALAVCYLISSSPSPELTEKVEPKNIMRSPWD